MVKYRRDAMNNNIDRPMDFLKVVSAAFFALLIAACDHPIEIIGEGDVTSASGTRDCSLEDYREGKDNCTKNTAVGTYYETYSAEPRAGWAFDSWQGCLTPVGDSCNFNIPADIVKKAWGQVIPPLVAVFVKTPEQTYSGSGLELAIDTEDGTNISVMEGEISKFPIAISKADPSIPVSIRMSEERTGLEIDGAPNNPTFIVNGSAIPAGSVVPVTIIVTNSSNDLSESYDVVVNVLEPKLIASGEVPRDGGAVISKGGAVGVHFDPGELDTKLGVEIRRAISPSGVSKIRIIFDRDVSSSNAKMTLVSNLAWESLDPDIVNVGVPPSPPLLASGSNEGYWIKEEIESYVGYFDHGNRLAKTSNFLNSMLDTCSFEENLGKEFSTVCLRLDSKAAVLEGSMRAKSNLNVAPVLFIHGYQAGGTLKGGAKYWNDFPKVVEEFSLPQKSGEVALPLASYEFRWRTNASFRVVADDLADAIKTIYDRNHRRPVRIIAHSYGGILIRTLLQGQARLSKDFDPNYVHSILTIGTPHSGIFAEPTEDTKYSYRKFPIGQDKWSSGLFNACGQVSCQEMGEPVSESAIRLAGAGYLGELAADLAESRNRLTDSVPIVVAIGLKRERGNQSTYDGGDGLISFNGQRFAPELAEVLPKDDQLPIDLERCQNSREYNLLTEVILGPLDALGHSSSKTVPFGLVPDFRGDELARGYAHSRINDDDLSWWPFDESTEYPQAFVNECENGTNCQPHAAVEIFKYMNGIPGSPGQPHRIPAYCTNRRQINLPSASMIGYSVQVTYLYPDEGTPTTVPLEKIIKSSTREIYGGEHQRIDTFDRGGIRQDIDFDSHFIRHKFIDGGRTSSSEFNGVIYKFDRSSPKIVNAFLDEASDFTSEELRVSFDEHTIWLNAEGVRINEGEEYTILLELEP